MSDEITYLDPGEPGESPLLRAFAGLPKLDPSVKAEWLEAELIPVSDCPRCYVCDGRRVWVGFRHVIEADDGEVLIGPAKPCIICNGRGRMPFIYPP